MKITKSFISGIPELLQRAFLNLGDKLFQTDSKFYTKEAFCATDELSLTATLNKIVQAHPGVIFGSYPTWTNQYYKTKVVPICTANILFTDLIDSF